MKSICIFPPLFKEIHKPYISLPALIGYLRGERHVVLGIDGNIEFYEYITSSKGLQNLKNEVDLVFEQLTKEEELFGNDLIKLSTISWMAKSQVNHIYNTAVKCKEILKSEEYYNFNKYSSAQIFFLNLIKIVDVLMFCDQDKLDISPYNNKRTLLSLVNEERYNPYKFYYEEKLLPQISAYNPKYIDITVDFITQFLPAIYLAKKIKELYRDEIFITLSGDACPRLNNSLIKIDYVFNFVDVIILYDREEVINEVIDAIDNKNFEAIKQFPNLAYKGKSKVIITEFDSVNCLDKWGSPDYSDIPIELFHSPEFEATVMTSYGCYWRKCKFCNIYLRCLEYNERSIERVLEDIKILKDKHSIKLLAFGDEEIKPERLFKIAKGLINEEINIKWSAQIRLELGFTKEVCQCLKESGCVYLGFGLESGCDNILKRMDTGTITEINTKVMSNIKETGIITNASMVIGFPEETDDEWSQTLNFLNENKHLIDSILPLCFSLTNGSIAEKNRKSIGIEKVYDESNYENINIAFPNYVDTKPNWKDREQRYFALLKLIEEKSPYFGMSYYPKLLYGYYFNANESEVMVEKVKYHMQILEEKLTKCLYNELNESYIITEMPFDINEINNKLCYLSSGNLPLKEIASIMCKNSFYVVDIVKNHWMPINQLQYLVLDKILKNKDLDNIASEVGLSVTTVGNLITILKIIHKNIFKKEI